ncbi:MAG: TetR/AcrR family transcriptional regulator [Clostridia bacterium]|nr:TetR/AcrR family transcriptional regulator [Clostridia bacterium]
MKGELSAEQKILIAAINCIEKYGPEGATIRRIADEAGVNSAAISYYYRSKDKLIERAMEQSLANGFDPGDYAEYQNEPAKKRLEMVLLRLVEGAYTYPGLTRAHFFDVFMKQDYTNPAVAKINDFFKSLLGDLKTSKEITTEDLELGLMQIAAAAFLLPALMPDLFEGFSGYDLKDRVKLKAYIRRAVERLL